MDLLLSENYRMEIQQVFWKIAVILLKETIDVFTIHHVISTESFELFYKQYHLHMSGRTIDDLGAQIYFGG